MLIDWWIGGWIVAHNPLDREFRRLRPGADFRTPVAHGGSGEALRMTMAEPRADRRRARLGDRLRRAVWHPGGPVPRGARGEFGAVSVPAHDFAARLDADRGDGIRDLGPRHHLPGRALPRSGRSCSRPRTASGASIRPGSRSRAISARGPGTCCSPSSCRRSRRTRSPAYVLRSASPGSCWCRPNSSA